MVVQRIVKLCSVKKSASVLEWLLTTLFLCLFIRLFIALIKHNFILLLHMPLLGPEISGECSAVNSTRDSLTFTWQSAVSATSYRLTGSGVDDRSSVNIITVNDLTPGSYNTFTVWAIISEDLVSNNITCTDSTGVLLFVLCHNNDTFYTVFQKKDKAAMFFVAALLYYSADSEKNCSHCFSCKVCILLFAGNIITTLFCET